MSSHLLASLHGLGVTYAGTGTNDGSGRRAALSDVDLAIPAGSRLAILGESGSGKSTLALALAGLLPEAVRMHGHIDWPGLKHPPRAGRDIGFVFQHAGASLNPVMRTDAQVAEVARVHLDLSRHDARDHVHLLFQRVGLPDPAAIMQAFPHQLSGGQRQRVAIAAAIAARPSLLIADEPTSALDTIVQAQIVMLLDTLVRDDGMTLIFITHDVALASRFADRIAVLDQGRLVEEGVAQEVLSAPRAMETARLIEGHIGLESTPLLLRGRS